MLELLKKLTDKHHKMERFSLIFVTLVVSMVLVVFGCIFGHSDVLNEALAYDTSLSTDFEMSKSKAKATVERFYASDDATKCFVLFKFADVSSISTDASKWSAFLTYAKTEGNPVGLSGIPEGIIYFFGTTGYGGVLLVNNEGFQQQVLQLTLRCTSDITGGDTAANPSESTTYTTFDQADVLFNPGATSVEPLPCLNQDDLPNRSDLYLQTVVAYDEADAKLALDEQLSKLQTDLASMSEYESRLETDGIIVPERPDYVAGDEIVTAADGTLSLVTSTVTKGGYNYDWRQGSVTTGYLDNLKSAEGLSRSTDENFFAYMNEQGDDFSDNITVDWTLTDGTPLDNLNEGGTGTNRYSRLMNDCTTLSKSWSQYMSDKSTYQTQLLRELLVLESNMKDVSDTSTQCEGAITVY